MNRLLLATVAVLGTASGCATTHVTMKLDKSESTIRSAQELGAATDPNAGVFLQRAIAEQDTARRLANVGDPRADGLLACAQADAELALALARETAATKQALRVADQVNLLRARENPR